MAKVRMYCTGVCPYCDRAERLLKRKGVEIDKIRIDKERSEAKRMMELTGRRSVPQIFIGEMHVGGFDELSELNITGELDDLLGTA